MIRWTCVWSMKISRQNFRLSLVCNTFLRISSNVVSAEETLRSKLSMIESTSRSTNKACSSSPYHLLQTNKVIYFFEHAQQLYPVLLYDSTTNNNIIIIIIITPYTGIGKKLNQYSVTLEVMFDEMPENLLALFNTALYNEKLSNVRTSAPPSPTPIQCNGNSIINIRSLMRINLHT